MQKQSKAAGENINIKTSIQNKVSKINILNRILQIRLDLL